MSYLRSKLTSRLGFSLIELLIAAVIGSIAVTAGFQLFINQNQTHIIQANISDMQQNARSAVDELVGKIRQAGYRLPIGVKCIRAWNSNPDTLAIAYMAEPICTARLSQSMASPSAELKCASSDLANFPQDIWAYAYDPATQTGEYFYVSSVVTTTHQIYHALAPLSKSYPLNSQVLVLSFYKFYVDRSDTLHPRLMVVQNGEAPTVYSDNIEDLQFRYVLASGLVYDTVAVDRYVRQVEVQVVARTEKNDLFMHQYRRDTLFTSVMVRNLGM